MSVSVDRVRQDSLYWLTGGLVASAFPHLYRLPIWIMGGFFLMCGIKLFFPALLGIRKGGFSLVQLCFLPLMAGSLIGIYLHFGVLVGLNPGVALLVLSIGFKMMEVEQSRDFYVACFIGYFLVVTNFLYTQSIGTALYMAVNILLITVGLVSFNDHGRSLSVRSVMGLAGTLLLQSVPVMLVLFLLFPRVSGPLWGMPKDAYSGLTGLDDEMSPGSVSQLVESDQVAFRVDFHGPQPAIATLYWRGVVLWDSDGVTWKRGALQDFLPAPVSPELPAVEYTVTLEPHNQKWLYALDVPGMATEGSGLTEDFQLFTSQPVRERVRYTMVSYPQYQMQSLDHAERKRALYLPYKRHLKTKQLVQEWKAQQLEEGQIIAHALQLFRQQDFYYTLRPPLLFGDRVDAFIFETKQGFCEHYASAFVVMMRAAGIPARVVLGYHGGAYNPVGEYMMVQQKNAHAWTEVWRDGSGWQRIDPTTAVDPSRVMHDSVDSALSGEVFNTPLVFGNSDVVRRFWQVLGYRWDAMNNQWNQWVISYGPNRQRMFFERLGFADVSWLSVVFFACALVGVMVFYFAYSMLCAVPKHTLVEVRLYQQFCKKLATVGIVRMGYEGPMHFALRAAKARGDLAQQIDCVTAAFVAVRYASDSTQMSVLRRSIRNFKV